MKCIFYYLKMKNFIDNMDITIEFISDYLNDKYENITFLSTRMNYYRNLDYHIYKFLEIINSWSRLESQSKKRVSRINS